MPTNKTKQIKGEGVIENKSQQSSFMGADLSVYLSYLLRYAHFPVTVAQLQKLATGKHFGRLVRYLDALPPTLEYPDAKAVIAHFDQLRQQKPQNTTKAKN